MQGNADASTMVASAFDQLSRNAEKIGQLNITPDLLQALLPREKSSSGSSMDSKSQRSK